MENYYDEDFKQQLKSRQESSRLSINKEINDQEILNGSAMNRIPDVTKPLGNKINLFPFNQKQLICKNDTVATLFANHKVFLSQA